MTEVGTGLLAIGAVAAVGVGLAVKKFAEFDQAMSFVQAATHESTENMGLLRDAALDAGASTVFSAAEAANAIEELAKAGVSTADILGGALQGSMDLAAAGGLGVARAAEISATALQQFSLDGDQASHVADVLAAGAGKAMGSVDDLANGLKFVGPVAASMGVSLEETTGVLALFAQQGIIGEQAGTGLRGVLASLTAPSALARKEIERLGLSLYDSQGNFLGLENAAGQLASAYTLMDEESRNASMGIIFGRETITSATALYQAGAAGVDEWTKSVDDSGYAAETAALRLGNLAGDWEALTGAIDTALISMGAGADGPLRALVQGLTGLVGVFNEAPSVVQQTTLAVVAVGAAAALAGGAFLVAVPRVAQFQVALASLASAQIPAVAAAAAGTQAAISRMSASMAATAKFMTGPWGVALAAAAVGVTFLTQWLESLQATSEEMQDSLKGARSAVEILDTATEGMDVAWWRDVSSAVSDLDSVLEKSIAKTENFFAVMGDNDYGAASTALSKIGKELGTLAESDLPAAQDAFALLADQTDGSDRKLHALLETMPEYKAALEEQAEALGLSENKYALLGIATGAIAGKAEESAAGLAELEGAAYDATGSVDELAESIRNFGVAQFDVNSATRAVEAAVDDFSASLAENGDTFDITTEAGRANQAALDDVAKSYLDLAASTVQQTGKASDAIPVIQRGRDAVVAAGQAAGKSKAEAEAYADSLGLIPSDVSTAVKVTGAETAKSKADAIANSFRLAAAAARQLAGINVGSSGSSGGGKQRIAANGLMQSYADGGFPTGVFAAGGRPMYKFAEPETRWEAFISGRPGQEDRNIGIALNALGRLGYRGFANGGDVRYASSGGGSSSTTSVSPFVSLAGAAIVLNVDGRQMTGFVQEQIVSSNAQSEQTLRGRKRVPR
jgi:TP901 family phage tail tape measure protein